MQISIYTSYLPVPSSVELKVNLFCGHSCASMAYCKMHLFITIVLSVGLHLVSCDLLEPSPSFGNILKCPQRGLTDVVGEPSLGNHGFKIKISGNPDKYVPGQMYTSMYTLPLFAYKRIAAKNVCLAKWINWRKLVVRFQLFSSAPEKWAKRKLGCWCVGLLDVHWRARIVTKWQACLQLPASTTATNYS